MPHLKRVKMVNFTLCIFYHNKRKSFSILYILLRLTIKEINPTTRSQQPITEGPQGGKAHGYHPVIWFQSEQTLLPQDTEGRKDASFLKGLTQLILHPRGSYTLGVTLMYSQCSQMKWIQFDEDDGKGILETGKFQWSSLRDFRCSWLGNCLEKKLFALSFWKSFLF